MTYFKKADRALMNQTEVPEFLPFKTGSAPLDYIVNKLSDGFNYYEVLTLRVDNIVCQATKFGYFIMPIVLVEYDGSEFVADGRHRLAALVKIADSLGVAYKDIDVAYIKYNLSRCEEDDLLKFNRILRKCRI